MFLLDSQNALDASLDRLMIIEPELEPVRDRCDDIALRRQEAGLAGLLRIILAQQVSVASARAIWEKFERRYPGCDPQHLAGESLEELRACSLSLPKARSVLAIVQAVVDGLDLEELGACSGGEIRQALLDLHGVGPWTADIYQLFCLGHGDIFPAGDLALQVAVQHYLGMDGRPNTKRLGEIVQLRWSPEGGAAAHLFWAYYRVIKAGRAGVI